MEGERVRCAIPSSDRDQTFVEQAEGLIVSPAADRACDRFAPIALRQRKSFECRDRHDGDTIIITDSQLAAYAIAQICLHPREDP